jgi:hypothetical protein
LGSDPRGGLGNSETRNLEYAQEYPGICTLGILESGICRGVSWNLPMRKHGIWILGSLCGPPCSHGGAPETRKLGIWNLQRSILESTHLETWNLDFGIPLQTHGGAPETRKLGIWNLLFGRIWVSVLQGCPPPLPPLALWVTAHPSPGPPPRPGQPLFVNGHLKIVQHLNTVIWKLGILKSFAFAFKMPSAPKSARPRTITYATMPSLTIAFVDSQRTQRYTRHRRVTTACRATGRSSSSSC